MVDYQKLYIDLFNLLSKKINELERIQENSLNEFVDSNPPKEDVAKLVKNLEL